MTTSSQRPQFGLASLFLATTFFAVVFGLFKALGPIALVVTVTVVWAVAVVWSLRRTYSRLEKKSAPRSFVWSFWFLVGIFVVIAAPMLAIAYLTFFHMVR